MLSPGGSAGAIALGNVIVRLPLPGCIIGISADAGAVGRISGAPCLSALRNGLVELNIVQSLAIAVSRSCQSVNKTLHRLQCTPVSAKQRGHDLQT